MSSFLTNLAKAGDSVNLAGPLGAFYLREIKRPLLLLAGGTGLAPFTAMLEKIAEQGCEHPLHLIYGVTHDHDLVEMDKLEAFAARIPNFTYSARSEEHTSELQSLMRISYAVFCLKKKKKKQII